MCSVFRCGVHGVNVAYSSFLGSCERERSGCCFGFRGSYSGILPDKFRILHKFAALAGSFFDKFVHFSLFTDPSWGKLCRPIQASLASLCFFPGHHPRAWLWSVVGGTIDCKAARVVGQGQVVEVVAIWSLHARWSCVELASVVRLRGKVFGPWE